MHVEAALGRAAFMQEQRRDPAQSLAALAPAIASAPLFIPALIEKAKVCVCVRKCVCVRVCVCVRKCVMVAYFFLNYSRTGAFLF